MKSASRTCGEAHFAEHRIQVQTYKFDVGRHVFVLIGQYETARKYPGFDTVDKISVIGPEGTRIKHRLDQLVVR